MKLPVNPPVLPMLAKRVGEVPAGDGWVYEPKWDGFRTLVFRDGDELLLQSRDGKPMGRYFPELDAPLRAALPPRCVLDGEVVIARKQGDAQLATTVLDFEALQMRIHPAASRVNMLAQEIPASIVFWDALALGDESLVARPFRERRAVLEELLEGVRPPIHLTPETRDHATAVEWFKRFEGAGLDGLMAKPEGGPYEPNKRAWIKVKHDRTCECVVAGFRWHKNGRNTLVGSLLLGLYDAEGRLNHVGVTASFTEAKRRELVETLAPYREGAREQHPWREWALGADGTLVGGEGERRPEMKSRWSRGKDLSWEPLRLELVAEVGYDHMQGRRFRHTAQFKRWRHDKPLNECDYAQLEVTPAYEIEAIFKGGRDDAKG